MHAADYVKVGIAAALVAWLIYATQVTPADDSHEVVVSFVESYVARGRAAVDAYSQRVERQLEKSLHKLFHQLDANDDGCIKVDEFKGVSLGVLAAVQAFEVPETLLPQFDTSVLPRFGDSVSLLRRIVGLQMLFLIALFIFEHIKSVVMPEPPSFDTRDYQSKSPEHTTKEVALSYDTPMTTYERVKMAFFILSGLLFLRIALSLAFFLLGIIFLNLSTYGGRTRDSNPLWYQVFAHLTKASGYLAIAALGFYQVRTYGTPAPRSEVKLLIANHVCMIELIVLFIQAEFPAFVSRVENLEIPLFRGVARTANAIMVNRSTASSRQQTLVEITRRAQDTSSLAPQLMIFPEGTIDNQRCLFQFKRGAFEPGVPVQMACFRFPYKHFNPAWTGRPCGGNDMPDLLLRMCCQFVNRVDVVYLPVYRPSDDEVAHPLLFAKHAQQMMANVLRLPTSDATFEDYVAIARASRRANREDAVVGDETPPRATTPAPQPSSPAAAAATLVDSATSPGSPADPTSA